MSFEVEIWEKYRLPLIFGGVGFAFIIIAFFLLLARQPEPEIQIIPFEATQGEPVPAAIFVDLQGAVEKPGVYQLPADSRLNDLLIRAGGLSAAADRGWTSRNLNLAARLSDGQKIYIPSQREVQRFAGPAQATGAITARTNPQADLLNINTATAGQLDSLPGIGQVRAQAIIQNRPYSSIEELLTKKIIPKSVYEKIKEKITL